MSRSSSLLLLVLFLAIRCLNVQSLFNAALYKPASMSSFYNTWIPNIGNDGSVQLITIETYFVHSYNEDNPWWMVDLNGQFVIEQIVFTNRGDDRGCALRLRTFQIDVFKTDPRKLDNFVNISGDICFNRTDPVDIGTFTWNCMTPITGRFLRLIRYGVYVPLHFVELQVMVSQEIQTFSSFTRILNSILDGPFIVTVTVSSPMECAQRCLKLRSESQCTAFNWMTSNSTCQFLSIDTRVKNTVLSMLRSFPDANFYMESN